MAHELEQFGEQTAFVSAREDAWHRLGTVLPDSFTAEEAMKFAHLADWDVRKQPLYTSDILSTQPLAIKDRFATIRTNPWTKQPEVLGVVGSKYTPIQNEDHADLLNALVDESGAHFETAGSIKGGTQTFMTMKLPNSMKIGGFDEIQPYIIALNSHDGSMAFQFLISPIRVVCANTQAAALKSAKSRFSVKHTKNGTKSIIAQARDALGMTYEYLEDFERKAEWMIQQELTIEEFGKVVDAILPLSEDASDLIINRVGAERATLVGLFETSETMSGIRGTAWSGYQAVTEYLDHYRTVSGKDTNQSSIYRAMQAVNGKSDEIKEKAFALLQRV
jgi:phage/plasmid-like protein (TIGR03299 family)